MAIITKLMQGRRLLWWEVGKGAGMFLLPVLVIAVVLGLPIPPMLIALSLHVICDFTLQSADVAMNKGTSKRHLAVHALCAGALPLAMASLAAADPVAVLAWGLWGFLSHFLVDSTGKFGLDEPWGPIADQFAHVVAIILATA